MRIASVLEIMLWWLSMTPLGSPLLPEEKMTVAKSLKNRLVICLPQNLPGGIWAGKVIDVKIGTTITSPIVITIDTGKEHLDINYNTGDMSMWYSVCLVHANHTEECKQCINGRWIPVMPGNRYPLEKAMLGRTFEIE